MKLNEQKTALALSLFIGGFHLLWSVVVAFGFAQFWMNWVYGWHMLNNPFVVQSFSLINAVILVVATGVIGYVMGYAFAWVWNWVHK